MKRRTSEVNTRTRIERLFFFFVPVVVLAMTTMSCGGDERHAERLWRQAIELVEKGDTQGAVDRLQMIIDSYPHSQIADKARQQIVVYRGLATAVENYPVRRAREIMVQIARAIETFRRDRGRPPVTLDELVPAMMVSIPNDPWDHPFLYETKAGGYRLRCRAGTGSLGNLPEPASLLIVDGEFRAVPP